jgi:hypothetical protein
MERGIGIRAISAPWHCGIEILVRQGNSVGVSVTMQDHDPATVVEPTLRIDMDAAQTLMDDLWQAGLRPTDGAGSAGAMRATEKHLHDMRKIAFRQLGIEG